MSAAENKKAALRGAIRSQWASMTLQELAASDRLIYQRLMSLPGYRSAGLVFCFVGSKREIDTLPVLQNLWSRGVKTAVPLCVSPDAMEARLITNMADLKMGAYGILEPNPESVRVQPGEIDLAIVPCVSCDRHCSRLGQGGGYYDRFLQGRGFLAVAPCRERLISDAVPVEAWDQPVDMVVTESHIYERDTAR